MNTEIEAKFLNVSHEEVRSKLILAKAECLHPMRLMRRKLYDYPDKRFQNNNHSQRLQVRDEGDKITVTYKESNATNYDHEVEIKVSSFEDACQLMRAIGLIEYSFEESKRETWILDSVEIVLDEWPWLNPYIEIEGPTEESIKETSHRLGFDWNEAKFGSVDIAYMNQYPGMKPSESISEVGEVRFDRPLPEFLRQRL